ncbi:MAG: glycosyltransferase family 39 protein [Candidatus Bathyarchaeota archaeon]|nr:glycosyltransferase family 39 protein [Candidatus Bathyarchaeota archaeon]
MHLNKRDVLTIVALSVIFLAIATWNVGAGAADYPVSTWEGTENRTFYVDLGSSQHVSTVYFLVKSGNASVNVYTGTPGNWSTAQTSTITGYSSWSSISVGSDSRYLRFEVQPGRWDSRPNFYWSVPNPTDVEPHPFVAISEITVLNQSNQKAQIVSLTNEGAADADLTRLVDEQAIAECPPTYISKMYFDEVYFARASRDYLNHVTSFERTHPPMGKLIQASGMAVFGDNPFGWRIMGVIFGTLMIPLMYLLGKKLFGTWIGGFSAAFLLTFDFMHFSMARMGTADTYVVFFSLMAQLFFLVYFMNVIKHGWKTSVLPLFGAFVFFALGFSTKWLSMWYALGLIALLAALRIRGLSKLKASLSAKYVAFFNHPFAVILGFVGVVVGIYFLTYIPDMLLGNSFPQIFNLQFEMYGFHSTLTASHTYSSAWWSWPLLVSYQGYVPLWLDITYLPNSVDSTISAMGNPAVWWVGFACMIVLTERAIRGKEILSGLKEKISKRRRAKETQVAEPQEAPVEPALAVEPSPVPPEPEPTPTLVEPEEASPASSKRKWNLAAIYIVAVFFFSWIPYVFITRATFIYHFYESVPLLCLAAAYFINKYWNTRKGKIAAVVFFAAVVVLFVAFYPVISGMPVSAEYIHKLKWFPSWFFAP